MSQVAVVTDSTASLPERMCERYQILMVPYCVHLGGRVARDMVDIKQEEFNVYLAGLPDGSELPRTATPGPGDYVRALGAAAKRAEENISFHVTSLGSGAYQAALVARDTVLKRLQGTRMKVVDTRNVSMGHGWMALQAARASASGASLGDIVEMVRKMIPVTRMIQTADTLRYLYMGGRIGRAKHLLGSLLKIKPLISMEDGIIVALGVARTRLAAYRRVAALVRKAVGHGARVRLALTHAASRPEAEKLRRLVREMIVPVEVLFCELCSALTVHVGPGTVGLCYTGERLAPAGRTFGPRGTKHWAARHEDHRRSDLRIGLESWDR